MPKSRRAKSRAKKDRSNSRKKARHRAEAERNEALRNASALPPVPGATPSGTERVLVGIVLCIAFFCLVSLTAATSLPALALLIFLWGAVVRYRRRSKRPKSTTYFSNGFCILGTAHWQAAFIATAIGDAIKLKRVVSGTRDHLEAYIGSTMLCRLPFVERQHRRLLDQQEATESDGHYRGAAPPLPASDQGLFLERLRPKAVDRSLEYALLACFAAAGSRYITDATEFEALSLVPTALAVIALVRLKQTSDPEPAPPPLGSERIELEGQTLHIADLIALRREPFQGWVASSESAHAMDLGTVNEQPIDPTILLAHLANITSEPTDG